MKSRSDGSSKATKFFKPEEAVFTGLQGEFMISIDYANAKLEREGQVVYLSGDQSEISRIKQDEKNYQVISSNFKNSKHKALLINIEPIEKCTHPKEKVKVAWDGDKNKQGCLPRFSEEFYKCECGAKVKPKEFEECE